MEADTTWVSEAREFVERNLGHKLKTKGQTRQAVGDELWRLILFSEFVFDSSGICRPPLRRSPAPSRLLRVLCSGLVRNCESTRTTKKPISAKPSRLRTIWFCPNALNPLLASVRVTRLRLKSATFFANVLMP